MPDLYRGALALVFPSLYEGFGLPVVEAMACGTPVLTSTTSSLPEVAADAGLCVDPDSVPAIARGIKQIVEDHPLRDSLRARGLVRAQQFHWDSVVRRTSMAISDALVGKSF
jgi:glycosyltransferase involved in cell wall biosynthesis